jgi:hypothetical protein
MAIKDGLHQLLTRWCTRTTKFANGLVSDDYGADGNWWLGYKCVGEFGGGIKELFWGKQKTSLISKRAGWGCGLGVAGGGVGSITLLWKELFSQIYLLRSAVTPSTVFISVTGPRCYL